MRRVVSMLCYAWPDKRSDMGGKDVELDRKCGPFRCRHLESRNSNMAPRRVRKERVDW